MKCAILYIFMFFSFSEAFLFNHENKHGVGVPFMSNFSYYFQYEEQFFNQKLDHFNPTDKTLWSQRFWRNPQFYKSGGPAFLMIEGEAPARAEWIVTGQWISFAKDNNAICFMVEHRYYGNSRPTIDASTENLQYLSSEQALADLAYFIEAMNEEYNLPKEIKWIVFGGSYAGSLAAWLRMKYPHLVYGAVSSSGPLLAKTDFYEYFQVVRNSLSLYDKGCVSAITDANKQLNKLVRTEIGRSQISEAFQLCQKLENNKKDISILFENLAGNFAEVVQYNKDNRKSKSSHVIIDTICDMMMQPADLPAWKRYAEVNKLMLNINNETCLSCNYSEYITNLQKTDWENASKNDRQWIYQTCTEFGFYQTSSRSTDLFSQHFPVSFFIEQCKNIFGTKFDEVLLSNAVNRTNILYGALDINVGNIVYVHGSVDPWHALGITKATNKPYAAIFIKGTAHCADMYPSSVKDSDELKSARKEIQRIINLWLKKKEIFQNYHYLVKFIYLPRMTKEVFV